jgi:hypothetical protein
MQNLNPRGLGVIQVEKHHGMKRRFPLHVSLTPFQNVLEI